MPVPEISLAQFNAIASGKYNAGQIDFRADANGGADLVKINNHVHSTSKNNVQLSPERIIEVKEAFLAALQRSGVGGASMAEIRKLLGLPTEMESTTDKKEMRKLLDYRFEPLTRAGVRAILDKYANGGRGFTQESASQITYEAAEKAHRTQQMPAGRVKDRKAVNIANRDAARKATYDYALTDALSLLSTSRDLDGFKTARHNRFTGPNAVNEKALSDAALRNDFQHLFNEALKMISDGVHESGEFRLAGLTAKLVKGEDGSLSAVVGSGVTAMTVKLGCDAETYAARLIGRASADRETLGAPVLRNLLESVYTRDIDAGLKADDRSSLTRNFAAFVLEGKAEDAWGQLVAGNYNTGILYELADRALEENKPGELDTKAKLDAYYADLAKGNADLTDEMKAMLLRVADVPFEMGNRNESEFKVTRPIVNDIAEAVAQIPPPPGKPPVVPRDIGGLDAIKDFVADFVFSDDTMVSDVLVNLAGEKLRNSLSDDKKLIAFATILKDPAVLDTALAPQIAAVVKEGFARLAALMDDLFKAFSGGETLAQAAQKPDFTARFSVFFRDQHALPTAVLAKFDAVVQSMANRGCEKLQEFINGVFKVNLANANAIGALTNEPYKNMSPDEIKAQLDGKSLNDILDAASNSDSPGQIGFFRQIISTYFTQLSKADKRSAFASAMRYAQTFDFGGKQGEELQSAKEAAVTKFTGAILKGTSPLLQKMLQGLPKDIVGKYADALADMKANLAPIPRKVVQAHLMKMIEGSNGKIHHIELKKSLGAASVGEAFLCTFGINARKPKYKVEPDGKGSFKMNPVLDQNGQQVIEDVVEEKEFVVKIMRHDAEKRVNAEAAIFTAAAEKIPGMAKTWEGQLRQYMTEFDFTNEAANVNEGVALYDVQGGKNPPLQAIAPAVKSMKVADIVPPSKDAMVCEVAEGKTADAYFKRKTTEIRNAAANALERDPATGRIKWETKIVDGKEKSVPVFKKNISAAAVTNMLDYVSAHHATLKKVSGNILQATKAWFYEALMGSGKFHGDTHSGNLMVTEKEVTFIDFGNLYKLDAHRPDGNGGFVNEQQELMKVITGAAFRDKNFILDAFKKLMSAEGRAALEANREKAKAILDSVLSKSKGGFSFNIVYRLQAAVVELQKLGLELPPQINCFIQSMVRLSNTVTEINTIVNQCSAILEASKRLVQPPPPERDELDLVGKAFDMFASEAGKTMEKPIPDPWDPRPPEGDVPHYLNFLLSDEMGGKYKIQSPLFRTGGEYVQKVATRIANAPDPLKAAEEVFNVIAKHTVGAENSGVANIVKDLANDLDTFRRDYTAAKTEGAKTVAVQRFAEIFAASERGILQNMYNGFNSMLAMKLKEPKTFASAITDILFDKFESVSNGFTEKEKDSLKTDVGLIAKFELGVGFWDLVSGNAEEKVLDAMKRDAQQMGGDNDYKVDIGI